MVARPLPILAPCVVRDPDALGRGATLGLRVAMFRVFIDKTVRYQFGQIRIDAFRGHSPRALGDGRRR